jgi:integrase/recombinase XerC
MSKMSGQDITQEVARLALKLGVDVETLIQEVQAAQKGVTVSTYVSSVRGAALPGAAKTYAAYWTAFVEQFGTREVASIKASEVTRFCREADRRAVKRQNSRGGTGAIENCVGAMRFFFSVAMKDGITKTNIAAEVQKPRRPRSNRRALSPDQIEQMYQVCLEGRDPTLDALLLRFHLETGARRGGAIALRLTDIDTTEQCIRLREKGNTERWQPISKSLMNALLEHGRSRGMKKPDDYVLRLAPRAGRKVGSPLTRRHYDSLASRWQRRLPFAQRLGVSIHWVRHTAITNVERIAGFGIAREYAGHFAPTAATTTTYIQATLEEVARVVELLTGEEHPLVKHR